VVIWTIILSSAAISVAAAWLFAPLECLAILVARRVRGKSCRE
jgi:hypothetical protein